MCCACWICSGPEPSFPLALAALLHDVGKRRTVGRTPDRYTFYYHEHVGRRMAAEICLRLKLSNEERERVEWLVEKHQFLCDVRQMRTSKLKTLLHHPGIRELLALHRADALASGRSTEHVEYCEQLLEEWSEAELNPPPMLTGHDLSRHGLKPGPLFKRLLDAVREAQLECTVTTKKQALEMVDRLVAEGKGMKRRKAPRPRGAASGEGLESLQGLPLTPTPLPEGRGHPHARLPGAESAFHKLCRIRQTTAAARAKFRRSAARPCRVPWAGLLSGNLLSRKAQASNRVLAARGGIVHEPACRTEPDAVRPRRLPGRPADCDVRRRPLRRRPGAGFARPPPRATRWPRWCPPPWRSAGDGTAIANKDFMERNAGNGCPEPPTSCDRPGRCQPCSR